MEEEEEEEEEEESRRRRRRNISPKALIMKQETGRRATV